MPEAISKVCIRWQTESPFFAEFLLRFIYKEDSKISTVAIAFNKYSHKLNLFYNKEFLEKLEDIEVESVAVHEIMHVLHKYKDRLDNRIHDLFNIAQDACINKIILDTTISGRQLKLPKGCVHFPDIVEMGYEDEAISELVYDFLYEKADKIYICSTGSTGEGAECPDCGGSGEKEGKDGEKKKCPICGGSGQVKGKKILKTTDDHTKNSGVPSEIEKAIIDDIVNSARVKSWGSVSGNMQSEINSLIKTKKIPWQRKLAMIMSKHVHEAGNIYENTWARRNRRGLPLPGIRKLSKRIVITVDTSGSISDPDLKMFFGQIEKLVKDYSNMKLIQWDTKVHSDIQYKKSSWKKITISGRGGTDPQDLYNYLNENYKNASVVVNFTDTYFSWDFENYGIPTVWAAINNPRFEAPFGKTVLIEREGEEEKNNDNWI